MFSEQVRQGQILANDFNKLLNDQLFTDLSITTSDKVVLKVHKMVLASRSPVFFSMMGEETISGSVNIPDLSSSVLSEMLSFIYSKQTKNLHDVVWDLVVAAEKYSIDELKVLCIDHVISNLSKETIFQALDLADRMPNLEQLFEKSVDFVVL